MVNLAKVQLATEAGWKSCSDPFAHVILQELPDHVVEVDVRRCDHGNPIVIVSMHKGTPETTYVFAFTTHPRGWAFLAVNENAFNVARALVSN